MFTQLVEQRCHWYLNAMFGVPLHVPSLDTQTPRTTRVDGAPVFAGGAATTTALSAAGAAAVPEVAFAVTWKPIGFPTSALVSVYELPVAPAIGVHDEFCLFDQPGQRYHWRVSVTGRSLCHVPSV